MTYDPNLSRDLIRETDNCGAPVSHAERALRNQLQLADDEIKRLSEWRLQQLKVVVWWSTLDEYLRARGEIKAGESISEAALKAIQERDTLKAALVNAAKVIHGLDEQRRQDMAQILKMLNIGGI